MDYGFTTAAYVVAAILFILSLGGLSGQESAKRAVWYGIAGMALAVVATLIGPGSGLWHCLDHPDLAGRCHRLSAGHQGPDDPNAGTCGCDALTRRSGGCFRRHHRAYRAWPRHGHGRCREEGIGGLCRPARQERRRRDLNPAG